MTLAKIKITGTIELLSGLHIGASSAYSAIGAVDSPIIKDPISNLPIIPGSSIKGKMRSLLASYYNEEIAQSHNDDHPRITRLFGASSGGGENGKGIIQGRLIFRDSYLSNREALSKQDIHVLTETKFENTINRTTAVASPRQIERAIKGSEFDFDIIYDMNDMNDMKEDFETIINGLRLIKSDYIGGNGSRGYGRITFKNLSVDNVIGEVDLTKFIKMMEEV